MAFGNVIPIDADVARQLARRQVRFRWLAVALFALWLAVAIPTLIFTPLPPIGPFVALAALVVLAEHRFVLFGDETSMSASIIVIVASIFVFMDTAPLAGPLLIASIAGLYFPHLRRRASSLVFANVAIFGLSAAIAAALASGLSGPTPASSVPSALTGVVAASVAYWYANSILTGFASATRHETRVLGAIRTQATSEWPVLLLTGAAGLLGIAAAHKTAAAALGTAVILLLFELLVRRFTCHAASHAPMTAHTAALVFGACAVTWHTAVMCTAVAAVGAFFAVAATGPSPGRPTAKACLILGACSVAATMEHLGLSRAAQFVLCVGVSLLALRILELKWGRHNHAAKPLPRSVMLGHMIPGVREASAIAVIATSLSISCGRHSEVVTAAIALVVIAAASKDQLRQTARLNSEWTRPTGLRSSVGASH